MRNATTRVLAVLLLLVPAPAGLAQSLDATAAGKKSEPRASRTETRTGGMKPCPEYGAGFYRLDGSATCVRVSGSVGAEIGTSGVRR